MMSAPTINSVDLYELSQRRMVVIWGLPVQNDGGLGYARQRYFGHWGNIYPQNLFQLINRLLQNKVDAPDDPSAGKHRQTHRKIAGAMTHHRVDSNNTVVHGRPMTEQSIEASRQARSARSFAVKTIAAPFEANTIQLWIAKIRQRSSVT